MLFMTIQNKPILSFEKVSVHLSGKCVLDHVTENFSEHQVYTILGPSGTGKTTLLKVLAGFIQPSQGSIYWQQAEYRPRDLKIGYVPQDYGLLPWQTVRKAVQESLTVGQRKKRLTLADQKKVATCLEDVFLTEVRDAYPKQLSGGQKQRVALARAFMLESDLLLMDEPFSALDAFTRREMQQLFQTMWHKSKPLTFFITHDIEEALILGDEVLVFKGSPGQVITREKGLRKSYRTEEELFTLQQSVDYFQRVNDLREELKGH